MDLCTVVKIIREALLERGVKTHDIGESIFGTRTHTIGVFSSLTEISVAKKQLDSTRYIGRGTLIDLHDPNSLDELARITDKKAWGKLMRKKTRKAKASIKSQR